MTTEREIARQKAGRDEKKRIRAAQLQARKETEQRLKEDSLRLFEQWASAFGCASSSIALAELVRYCNRLAKGYPKYKERSSIQKMQVEMIYELKDAWILANKDRCVAHCRSEIHRHVQTDWESFHCDKIFTNDWVDPEDYEYIVETVFYAYKFDIEGVEFRFHSLTRLFPEDDNLPVDASTEGSAKPLSADEKVIDVISACAMLSVQMDSYEEHKRILVNMLKKEAKNLQTAHGKSL